MLIFQVAVLSWVRTIANHSILYIIIFVFSYLLGLLAKIKCSISSSQPDLWDCKQLAYNWRLGNFMKPYCHKFHYSLLAMSDSFLLAGMWPQYCSISESCRLNTYFTLWLRIGCSIDLACDLFVCNFPKTNDIKLALSR